MPLKENLFSFLDKYYENDRPVLLGLSGGADSLSLFYLLKEYAQNTSFRFGIAHVDHGWRDESQEEALQLQELAKEIPFHLKKLDPRLLHGNMEEACRQERLSFFSELCSQFGYQAVILGHQADDQTETILKKVLEGRSLTHLNGMALISKNQGLTIWRPLLNCSKKEIKQWLKERGFVPFEDRTNVDPKFLRARFRTRIIPQLSQDFGKNIDASLQRLGHEAEELKAYLDHQLKETIETISQGPFGTCLDLSHNCPSTDLELKYLIRKVLEKENVTLSWPLILEASQKLRAKSPNCQLLSKNAYVYLDRGRIFVLSKPLEAFKYEIPLEIGQYSAGAWHIEVKEGEIRPLTGWKEAWKGELSVALPKGNYCLKIAESSLSKWWTNHKIPAFMRYAFPVIASSSGIHYEFLSNRHFMKTDPKTTISISIKVTYL